MNLSALLHALENAPDSVEFEDTMAVIEALYDFTPVAFNNGGITNAAGQNSGSCKLFAFARLQGLSPQQTLACFGRYYRDDVQKNPGGTDHQNIRNFIEHGWAGIHFDALPLTAKTTE